MTITEIGQRVLAEARGHDCGSSKTRL